MFRKRDTHIHFVGIGGIGMSGIAEVLLNLGYRVSGSDTATTEVTRRLEGLGARISPRHTADAIADADVVVISSAIPSDNAEVEAARAAQIPVIARAEMLGELLRLKDGVLVAGSHGKTTTTSLLATVLDAAGLDPTVVIGGKLNAIDSNARLGQGDLMVAEADESDGSFLLLPPTIAVLTNIDAEHLEHYGSIERLEDAFVTFANRVPFFGMVVLCADDARLRKIAPRINKRWVSYGIEHEDADYVGYDLAHHGTNTTFRARHLDRDLGEFHLHMPGRHNVKNALATIAASEALAIHLEVVRQALTDFEGVQRRFTLRGEPRGITIIDDYGHHPSELAATLQGARAAWPKRRLIAVVQPHRFTRLRDNFAAFVSCLQAADVVVIAPVYAAGEPAIPGFDAESLTHALTKEIANRGAATTVHGVIEFADLTAFLTKLVAPEDVVITMGAGSITKISYELVAALA